MEHFIRQIFAGKKSDHVHRKFIKYGRGRFAGPALRVSVKKGEVKVRGSFHIVDELLHFAAKYVHEDSVRIKGVINQNKDLTEQFAAIGLKYMKVSKRRGIFHYEIDNDVNLKEFVKYFAEYMPFISFKTDTIKLSTKRKVPDKKGQESGISSNFCFLNVPAEFGQELLDNYCFDAPEKKYGSAKIVHYYHIDEVIFPENASELSFEDVRYQSKRKGSVKRVAEYTACEPKEAEIDFLV